MTLLHRRFKLLLPVVLLCMSFQTGRSQVGDCTAVLENDTLVIGNQLIQRSFLWNGGAIQSLGIVNKSTGAVIAGSSMQAKSDFLVPGITTKMQLGTLEVYRVEATNSTGAHLAAAIVTKLEGLFLKRIFRIYPGVPAIACDYYLRGKAGAWANAYAGTGTFTNIENENTRASIDGNVLLTDRVPITGNHWQIKAIEFFDATDYNNNLVQENNTLIYRQEKKLRGNVLLANNRQDNNAFFILKEAPVSGIQLYYPGFDFTSKLGEIKVAGIGIAPNDLSDSTWVKGYSVVVGVSEQGGETGLLPGLRKYQQVLRTYQPERDAMIVANTWGDRSQDSRVNEQFILQELESASKLGITHLQIDDGWQTGISSNSALGGSLQNIWRNPRYWEVDAKKFPSGFAPVLNAAKKKGIIVSLWFNPSTDSSFKNWEKDADVLIAQYKKYGISMWKIDGVQAPDKNAEINFRRFLNKVMEATGHNAVFNLDVTAGRRFGYHYMNTYGNLFLENRYTDWGNYYPHFTLRNLWQLSAYMPVQRLQIEFLNKWRNASKYPAGDVLAPGNYSFDYLFAISMVAQPLAWFEVSGLPPEAFTTAKLVSQYKRIREGWHSGTILPIGNEPSGFGWTGFQSIQDKKGYLLVFRENNELAQQSLATRLAPGKKVTLKLIAGTGKNFKTVVGRNGEIVFGLPQKRSFALYEYEAD